MRLHLNLSPSLEYIPHDYKKLIVKKLHQWIGKNNELHDDISLYSISNIYGTDLISEKKGYVLQQKGSFFISMYNQQVAKHLISEIQKSPDLFCGMKVTGLDIQQTPNFKSGEYLFRVASPVLVKKDGKSYTYEDEISNEIMTNIFHTKLKKANVTTEGASIRFDLSYRGKKTKSIQYKTGYVKSNICPIILKTTTPEQAEVAYHSGAGGSTGIGFGALE